VATEKGAFKGGGSAGHPSFSMARDYAKNPDKTGNDWRVGWENQIANELDSRRGERTRGGFD
jgi:hypothetical protein